MAEEKKYSGYGYHGGGRPRKDEADKRVKVWLSCRQDQKDQLNEAAEKAGLTLSAFILDKCLS